MRANTRIHRFGWYLLILLSAALVSLPLVVHGPSCGHDFDFHLQSWFAVQDAWRSGLLAPHWVSAANYGAGEPRLLFYPPLSWALGPLLGLTLPWQSVPAAFTFLALGGAGLAFHRLACRSMTPLAATLAACLYLGNPYLLFVAYERTAYGELLAAATIPLILLYALRSSPPVGRLALVIAALWFTNAPAAVMGCYLLAFCVAASAIASRSLLPAARGLAAVILGSGLAAVYLLPAWYEQRWVEISRVVDPGMRVEDSFLFGHTGEAYHDQVLHTASLLAVALLGSGLFCLLVHWLLQHAATRSVIVPAGPSSAPAADRLPPDRLPPLLLALLMAILFLMLPVSRVIWTHAPQLHFLQFPWRWLLVAGVAAALAAGTLLDYLLRTFIIRAPSALGRALLPVALLASALGAGIVAQHRFAQPCDEEDNVTAQQLLLAPADAADPRSSPGFEGTDEYTPAGADNGEIQQGLPPARLLRSPDEDEGDDTAAPNPDWQQPASDPLPGSISITRWVPEHRRLIISAHSPGWLVLRLMDYPAWQLRLNGKLLGARPHREDGLLTVPISSGTTEVAIDWRTTPDVLAGRSLSLFSLLALCTVAASRRRHRTRKPARGLVYDQRG